MTRSGHPRRAFARDDLWRNGRTRVRGLNENVEILTDRHGVPHIFAGNFEDMYFAQGYVHARERLWQLELNRRVGQGRLAQILGSGALPADRFLRKLGLEAASDRHWDSLDGEVRSFVEAYAAGVNAGAEGQVPPEFRFLGIKPKPWRPQDSVLWSKVMAWDMSSNWECELLRGRILQRLGPEQAALFHQAYPESLPSAAGGPVQRLPEALEALAREYAEAQPWLDRASFGRFAGSNAWAVSGRFTADGKPLLASDPHVLVRLPSTWYEVHMQVGDWWCYGASLAGLPGIMLGQNAQVAWGITNAYVDVQDLTLEELSERQIRGFDGFQPVRVREEIIQVKGKKPVVEEVWEGPNGPLLYRDETVGIGLRWTGFEVENDRTVDSIFALNGAASADELRAALSGWHCPCLNFVYASAEGDVGYQLAGTAPIRSRGTGALPVPGYQRDYAWTGRIPYEELPHRRNPDCGYVISANNAMADEHYPHFLTHDTLAGFRAQRIEQLLQAQPRHTMDDFARYQTDVLCLPGLRFARAVERLEPDSSLEQRALELLRDWDGRAGADSQAAAVYQVWMLQLGKAAFAGLLGAELHQYWMGGADSPLATMGPHGGRYVGFLLEALEKNDVRLLQGRSWETVLRESLRATVRELGPVVSEWSWGRMHSLELQHPMGAVRQLKRFFNSPEVPFGGDTDTICQSAVIPHKPYRTECWAPSWRFVVSLGNPRDARSILPSGQSGWPGDPHYLDHFEDWLEGRLHRSLVARGALEASHPRRLVLLPS